MAHVNWGYKNPLYYEDDVLNNLEKFNLKIDDSTNASNNNFANVLGALDKTAESITSTISDEAEQSRIQAQIHSEKIEEGFSETNYNLLNISSGIDELGNTVRKSSEEICEQIHTSSLNIVSAIAETNSALYSIDNNLLAINDSLKHIGNILGIILERINKPNEVKAIELADQIRISLAIGKREDALRITRKAMDLSSTSITVTAYHLMTLSLFDDEQLRKESKIVFNDFVNLINFKLHDDGSDIESVRDEIYYLFFPVLYTLSRSLGGKILNDTQRLYSFISTDTTVFEKLLTKPLVDKSTEQMTLHPSPIRELHWTVILTELISTNKPIEKPLIILPIMSSFEKLLIYIHKVAKNNILIKNELLIEANKVFFESGLLQVLLNEVWHEDTATDEELECLNIFISIQPHVYFQLNDKILLLLDRYVTKYNLPINSSLKTKLNSVNKKMNQEIEKYLLDWKKYKETLREIENKELEKLDSMVSNFNELIKIEIDKKRIEINKKKMDNEKRKKANLPIENKINSLHLKLKEIKTQENNIRDKIRLLEGVDFKRLKWLVAFLTGILAHYNFGQTGFTFWGIFTIPFYTIIFGLPLGILFVRFLNFLKTSYLPKRINNLLGKSSNLKDKIYDIKNSLEQIIDGSTFENEISSFEKKIFYNYSNQLLSYRENNVDQIKNKYNSKLEAVYNQITSHFFFKETEKTKITKEMEKLLDGNPPYNINISDKFYQKYNSIRSKLQ